jgi:hypothetical protein
MISVVMILSVQYIYGYKKGIQLFPYGQLTILLGMFVANTTESFIRPVVGTQKLLIAFTIVAALSSLLLRNITRI